MKILFVDDDQGLLDQAKYVLEKENDDFEVIPIQSSDEALEYLNNNSADIIISDYKMPGMDGIDLLKKIREREDDIPFIIFTGKGREEVAMKALNLGANRYFRKGGDPISQYEVLAQAIIKEINHYRAKKDREKVVSEIDLIKKKYRTLFDNINMPSVVVDKNEKIVIANRSFEKLTKYSRKELEKKKDWFRFINDKDKDKIKKIHDLRNIDEKMAKKGYNFELVDKYGELSKCYATFTHIPESEESLIYILDLLNLSDIESELMDVGQLIFKDGLDEIQGHIQSFSQELFEGDTLKKSIKDWCLEEILVMLIDNQGGASGKELMTLLNETFIVELSSSTVYPKLHELEERGVLKVHKHVRTKEYSIKDEDSTNDMIHSKIKQLYGMYLILRLLMLERDE